MVQEHAHLIRTSGLEAVAAKIKGPTPQVQDEEVGEAGGPMNAQSEWRRNLVPK